MRPHHSPYLYRNQLFFVYKKTALSNDVFMRFSWLPILPSFRYGLHSSSGFCLAPGPERILRVAGWQSVTTESDTGAGRTQRPQGAKRSTRGQPFGRTASPVAAAVRSQTCRSPSMCICCGTRALDGCALAARGMDRRRLQYFLVARQHHQHRALHRNVAKAVQEYLAIRRPTGVNDDREPARSTPSPRAIQLKSLAQLRAVGSGDMPSEGVHPPNRKRKRHRRPRHPSKSQTKTRLKALPHP